MGLCPSAEAAEEEREPGGPSGALHLQEGKCPACCLACLPGDWVVLAGSHTVCSPPASLQGEASWGDVFLFPPQFCRSFPGQALRAPGAVGWSPLNPQGDGQASPGTSASRRHDWSQARKLHTPAPHALPPRDWQCRQLQEGKRGPSTKPPSRAGQALLGTLVALARRGWVPLPHAELQQPHPAPLTQSELGLSPSRPLPRSGGRH